MARASKSKSAEKQSTVYKAGRKWEKNRKLKLERALKAQPNNEQIKNALKQMVYRRKTPVTRPWSASWVRAAKIIKEFSGRFDPAIMSSNADVARSALQKPGPVALTYVVKPAADKDFFSILARVNMRTGT